MLLPDRLAWHDNVLLLRADTWVGHLSLPVVRAANARTCKMFLSTPIENHRDYFDSKKNLPDFDHVLLEGFNAISAYSDLQDYEGMASVYNLISEYLDRVDRTKIVKGLIWNSLHGMRPNPIEHKHWVEEWHTLEVAAWRKANPPKPIRRRGGTKLRVGIVGLDIMSQDTSISNHLEKFFLSLCQNTIDLVLYSQLKIKLPVDLQKRNIILRIIGRLDRSFAEISADGLDFLLVISGINIESGSATGEADQVWKLFAARPARFIGLLVHPYPTWGQGIFDFSVLDPVVAPPSHDDLVWERVERITCCAVLSPPVDAPAVSALPALSRGYCTFGSFNRPSKIDSQFVELWHAILMRLPTARLLLSHAQFSDAVHRERIETLMRDAGVPRDRVDLRDDFPERAEFLARYSLVDVALDPLWFNGGMTTFDSLWQGVPVLTCPSHYFIGRMTLMMLTQLNLTDWAVPSLAAYVDRAVAAAEDLEGLATLRAALRDRIVGSRLVDHEAHGAELSDLLTRIASGPERPR